MLRALDADVQSSYNVDVDEGDVDEILAGYDYERKRDDYQAPRDPGRNLRMLC